MPSRWKPSGGYRAELAHDWLSTLVGECRLKPPDGWRPLWRTPEEAWPKCLVVGPASDGNLWARVSEVSADGIRRYCWSQVAVDPQYLDEFAMLAGWIPYLD